MKKKEEGYTRKQVSEMLKLSASSIQMYTDRGIITPKVANPSGKGTVRRYSAENLVELLIIKELQGYGVPLKKIDNIIKAKWQMALIWKMLDEKSSPETSKIWLILYNPRIIQEELYWSIYEPNPNESFVKFPMDKGQSALIIDISVMVKKVRDLINI